MSMKIVVLGGSGLVGSKLVDRLALRGLEAVAASRRTGVDALTGKGLAAAFEGAHAVVDATNAPVFEDPEVAAFFRQASERLLQIAGQAGIEHYLALSVVGTERLQGSAYFRAKATQERLVSQSPVPYTLVRATQFYEFMANIVPPGVGHGPVRLSPAQVQPVAANDVADLLAERVGASPVNGIVEIAGPERYRLNELAEWVMYSYQDDRPVVADADVLYYGARLDDDTLTPAGEALRGETSFGDWLDGYLTGAVRIPVVHHPDPLAVPR